MSNPTEYFQRVAMPGVELDLSGSGLTGKYLVPLSLFPKYQARNDKNDDQDEHDFALNAVYDSASSSNDVELQGVVLCNVDKITARDAPIMVLCQTY